jgi:hypothetical protein
MFDKDRIITFRKLNMLYITSFRYCLGRRTYIVGEFYDNFIEDYKYLNDKTLLSMEKDITDAYNLGDNCDKVIWHNVLILITTELKQREEKKNENK